MSIGLVDARASSWRGESAGNLGEVEVILVPLMTTHTWTGRRTCDGAPSWSAPCPVVDLTPVTTVVGLGLR
jgi:hypothetical protein